MKNRELCVCDEEKIMADCRQAAGELAESINGKILNNSTGPQKEAGQL